MLRDEVRPKAESEFGDDLSDWRARSGSTPRIGDHPIHRSAKNQPRTGAPREYQAILEPVRATEIGAQRMMQAVACSDLEAMKESKKDLRDSQILFV